MWQVIANLHGIKATQETNKSKFSTALYSLVNLFIVYYLFVKYKRYFLLLFKLMSYQDVVDIGFLQTPFLSYR